MRAYVVSILKALIISYVISAASLLVLAALLYWLDIAAAKLQIGVIATYVGSCLIGGFLCGKEDEGTGVFLGADCRRPLLQYSYCGGGSGGGRTAGAHCTGDGSGPFVHGKRDARRHVELTGVLR